MPEIDDPQSMKSDRLALGSEYFQRLHPILGLTGYGPGSKYTAHGKVFETGGYDLEPV
jgi:hypothetical protein